MKKGQKYWCWWMSRFVWFTGKEGTERGLNTETWDYTPRHYYKFEDTDGATIRIYDKDINKLEER